MLASRAETPSDGPKPLRTHHDVGEYLVVGHLDVADSDAQTKPLSELELDGGAHVGEPVLEILRM